MLDKIVILLGYSGHGFVVAETAIKCGIKITGYCDIEEKKDNPFRLKFLGSEKTLGDEYFKEPYQFIWGIGDINLRKNIMDFINSKGGVFLKLIDSSASISKSVTLGHGSFVSQNVAINSFSSVGENCILNTGSIIEHECILSDNVHIAPGAVLAGNVRVGNNSFIGANSVVIQGINIGENVVIGAGSVVIKDVGDNKVIVGNPGREI